MARSHEIQRAADARRRPRPSVWAAALLMPFALAGCSPGGQTSGGSSSGPSSHDLARFLSSRPATKTATIKLTAADGNANSGYNFDGYANGSLVFTVPVGWNVKVELTNSGMMPHSAMIITRQAQKANNVALPAFPGAETPDPGQGAGMGSTQDFTFLASKPGVFSIACGVSGHDADGMWDTLIVTQAVKAPTVGMQSKTPGGGS